MKHILFLIQFMCLMFCINALTFTEAKSQTVISPYLTDTLTNADTLRAAIRVPGVNSVLTFQANYTKISGTPASSIILQASLDGVNYYTVPGADTLTVTNVATVQTKLWPLSGSAYLWYRLYGVTSGTQSGQIKTFMLNRQ